MLEKKKNNNPVPTFFLSTFVVVIVYHPCEFIIRLAVRQQTNVTHTSTCDGTVVPQHGVFTVSFYFYCVMTQSEAHNVDQAWWPGVCVCSCVSVCERENNRLCMCLWGKEKRPRESVCTSGQADFKQLYSLHTSIYKPVGS